VLSIDRRAFLSTVLASGVAVLAGCGSAEAAPRFPAGTHLLPPQALEAAREARRQAVSADLVTRTADGVRIALTFDDGPGPETDDILDILRDADVRAVFCVVGKHVQKYPQLVRRIVDEGHRLGNHSMDHDHTMWKQGMTPAEYQKDLTRASSAILDAAPDAEIAFFRAPFGAWGRDHIAARVAADMGMTPLSWTLSTTDWDPRATVESIYRRITAAEPGDVILLHDADDKGVQDRLKTVGAVERAIPDMKRSGHRFGRPRPHRRIPAAEAAQAGGTG
jgi:peptidoglycan/xylan/chitin deacetylase (PgdA/CDA1 family)